MRIKRLPLFLSLLMLAGMLWMVPPASATEDNRAGCDSCLMKVNNLDKPFSLVGTWLFTREDNPANKDPETDTSSWKLSRAPGSWKQAYSDGKNFKVGWLRGNFIFDKSLIGQEVVLLIDTYMGRTTIYLDGQEIYHRGDPHNMQRYYAVQAIPVRFKITQPRHVIAIRVDTILMVGVYQLPFQLRAYSPTDHTLAFASLWGGELRMIAAHVIVLFGLFFLLVYFKTRYLLYLIAAGACITIYPFYAYPGDIFLKFFPPETMLLFHYTGIGTMALFHYYFAQFFYKATPRLNYFHGVFIGLLCLLFTGLFISFNLDVFQIARSVMLLYSLLALAIPFGYFYIRGVLKKKKYALTMAVGAVFFVLTCIHDVLLALGKIDSIAMIFGGSLIATSAMLWVASNMFADTFLENKRINANLELIVAERTEQLRQSEERYRTILDVMADAYFEVDVAGNYTFVNDATCRHLGYPREELIGTSFRDQVVKDEIDKVYQAFGKIYTTCKPVRAISYKFLRKDETTGFGEMSGFPLQNQKGEIVGFRGVSRDITERKKMEEALMQSEEKHRTIIENIQDGYCEVDLAGNFTFFNDSTCEIYGYSREELMGMSHRHCADKENAKKVFEAFNEIYRTGLAGSLFDYEIIRKDGTRRQIEISASLRKDSSGNPIGFSGTVRDATERKRTEEALRQSEVKYRTILESMQEGYFEVDLAGNFTFFNDSTCLLLGYSQEEMMGMNNRQYTDEENAKKLFKTFNEIYRTGEPAKEFYWQVIIKNGTKRLLETSVWLIKDLSDKQIGFRGIIRDITERKQLEEEIHFQATHDALTGLSNRLMFGQMLNHAIQSAKRNQRQFAVLFIDLDRFKIINDTLGHDAGDQLLQEIATRLKQTLRATDLIARLGGDEFTILIEEVSDANHVATVAHKIITSIIQPLTLVGQECRITASIGISIYPKDAEDEQSLMKNADLAMYLAKEEGKNNYQFYSEDIQSKSLERLSIETNLRFALERNEFSLHYQAQVNFKTNVISGVEALLRWDNPYLGSVTPTQFIPVAEETGLIVPIGNWVLRTACAQNVAWQREGLPPVCMAVNLSLRQLTDENLINDIRAALNDSGMAPNLLELEITESMVMRNPDRMIAVLAEIKSLGVRLALDDFGTGYSSLAQIKHFPVDTLKVDRSFIRNIPKDSEDKAITEAIIAMGKTLSLTVVAEGVETLDQMNFLKDHSCDEMQGYYFSKPIIPEHFADLLREHVPSPEKRK